MNGKKELHTIRAWLMKSDVVFKVCIRQITLWEPSQEAFVSSMHQNYARIILQTFA